MERKNAWYGIPTAHNISLNTDYFPVPCPGRQKYRFFPELLLLVSGVTVTGGEPFPRKAQALISVPPAAHLPIQVVPSSRSVPPSLPPCFCVPCRRRIPLFGILGASLAPNQV